MDDADTMTFPPVPPAPPAGPVPPVVIAPPPVEPQAPSARVPRRVWEMFALMVGGGVGAGLCLTGFIAGIWRATSDKRLATCAGAVRRPAGVRPEVKCLIHPHAFEGAAMSLFSAILAVLIAFAFAVAVILLRRRSTSI